MKVIDVKIHKVIVPIKPDTVHIGRYRGQVLSGCHPRRTRPGRDARPREAVERYRVD